MLRKLLMA